MQTKPEKSNVQSARTVAAWRKPLPPEKMAKIQAVFAQASDGIVRALAEQHRLGHNGL